MKEKFAFKKMLSDFLNINAETTLSIAIIGTIFAKDVQIGFQHFFLPICLSLLYLIPCIPLYFKENLPIKYVLIQRVAELVFIEAISIITAYLLIGHVLNIWGYVVIGVSVMIFDFLTYLLQWFFEKSTADKINNAIAELRKNQADSDK
ncbi:MAG: hypothetical protein ACI4JY_05185 [Oscillospiraceae bacterium]